MTVFYRTAARTAACAAVLVLLLCSLFGAAGCSPKKEASVAGITSDTENRLTMGWDEVDAQRSYPRVEGTFLQPELAHSFSEEDWAEHMDMLLEAGIRLVILQWTVSLSDGLVQQIYYPSGLEFAKAGNYQAYDYVLERCLAAAQERGMQVFIGLDLDESWWENGRRTEAWCLERAEQGNRIAGEIHRLYKERYPDAFAGWYWAYELSNGMGEKSELYAQMLSIQADYLTTLDPTLPLMLSPFCCQANTPAQAEEEWTRFLDAARLREGDILALQDAVGAGHISLDQMDGYFRAFHNAAAQKEGLRFWANNENFTASTWDCAPLSRFVTQMNTAAPYVEKHVTFAYSHYYNPQRWPETYHQSYIAYAKTGVIPDNAP